MELHDAVKTHGGIRPAARALGIGESTLRYRLERERQTSLRSFVLPEALTLPLDPTRTSHFIVTAAQDKTEIHKDFWRNLKTYADFLGASILVGGFTYSKRLFTENDPRVRSDDVWFDRDIEPYIVHDQVQIGENILFCAEMNTLPTAVQPLSGLEVYTGSKWGIFPHAKVQLRSIATMPDTIAKQIMTTGAVTLPNYIRKKAGVKAEFFHAVGAMVVSVSPDGAFWCRHIQANSLTDGSFYDLDRLVSKGTVKGGQRPEAVVHGDIHREKLDPEVALATWGFDMSTGTADEEYPSVTRMLRPKRRVFHDLTDFTARNHHNIKDHHFMFKAHFHGRNNVKQDIQDSADFMKAINIPEIEDVVIQSNHDNALLKWVKTAEVKYDPENYEFWLECELSCIRALRFGIEPQLYFDVMGHLIGELDHKIIFVQEDASYTVKGVELGMHGHYGANGAKGSPASFAKMGPKSITGHSHSPSITDGHVCVGVSGQMDMGYNKGLSSWSHTDALVYPNGKRALMTLMGGRWFDSSSSQSSLDL
jgi:hypothetical protein